MIEKRGREPRILVHHPQQEALSHDQARRVRTDVEDVLSCESNQDNRPGISRDRSRPFALAIWK